jgi:hypothetical protein
MQPVRLPSIFNEISSFIGDRLHAYSAMAALNEYTPSDRRPYRSTIRPPFNLSRKKRAAAPVGLFWHRTKHRVSQTPRSEYVPAESLRELNKGSQARAWAATPHASTIGTSPPHAQRYPSPPRAFDAATSCPNLLHASHQTSTAGA